jgi:hypothetical protein
MIECGLAGKLEEGRAASKIGWDARRLPQQAPLPESWNDDPVTGTKAKS